MKKENRTELDMSNEEKSLGLSDELLEGVNGGGLHHRKTRREPKPDWTDITGTSANRKEPGVRVREERCCPSLLFCLTKGGSKRVSRKPFSFFVRYDHGVSYCAHQPMPCVHPPRCQSRLAKRVV